MALGDVLEMIREDLEQYNEDRIAFAKYDAQAPAGAKFVYHRITDVKVTSGEVLLVIDPTPMKHEAMTGSILHDLLMQLRQLPAEYANYPLEASEPEIEIEEEDVRMRFDYPITGIGRNESLRLSLLIHVQHHSKPVSTPWWKFWRRT
jgi:hypothetical protein